VHNNGREPTDPTGSLSFTSNLGPLTGFWSQNPIPTYGYSTFTPNEAIDTEGDAIMLYENAELVDVVAFGQNGVAPDPLDGESVARHFNITSSSYTDDWVRDPTPTWDAENDCGWVILSPNLVLNKVMFNPLDPIEGYVELMYIGSSSCDISGYKIVCDDEFVIPGGTILTSTNRHFTLPYSAMNIFFINMDANGDNVYLYDASDNLMDMVGWSSLHNLGEYMTRSPDGNGTYQGYDDITSIAAGWVFDNPSILIITEFYTDAVTAQIEVYNPSGGDKVLDSVPQRWTFEVNSGPLTGTWSPSVIPVGGYSTFTLTGGTPGGEGDTISLFYNGTILEDVSYGTSGVVPDPLSGETSARYWDSSINKYSDDWTREDTPTFGAQNDVPATNLSSFIILNEIMFNPIVDPTGKYVVLINRNPDFSVPIQNYYLVSDGVYQIPWAVTIDPGEKIIIKYGDDPAADNFFSTTTTSGDNIYLYDPDGRLCDMVGWKTAHTVGMSARRVHDGYGTQDGYEDTSSIAAGWVFDSPFEVQITEISDNESPLNKIEIFNLYYPDIDFGAPGIFELRNALGNPLPGSWTTPIAVPRGYAVFQVTSGLNFDGDIIGFYQNGILMEEIGYGTYGIAPDPLSDESVERYWDGSKYTSVWERNWSTGSNFGFQNDVPPANFSSAVLLNEIMFNPTTPGDYFVTLYLLYGSLDISGYKIVGDLVYIIPYGTILDLSNPYYNLTQAMFPALFAAQDINGDNVYLYDDNGSLLDMAGWSSSHTQGKTMRRVPDGNGTRDGYNDTSSIAAGWVFDGDPPPPPPLPPSPPTGLMAKLISNGTDIMLIWNASLDDGTGEDDVAGYTVYKSTTGVNGSYDFAAWILATDSSSYNWTDVNVGDGDWNDYFYNVRANDTVNNEEKNENKAGKFVNYLYGEWNMFSVPLIQFQISSDYVLQTIQGNYTVLQGYHAGKSRPWIHWHWKKPPPFNDIIRIDHKSGYYIRMANPDYLVVAGAVPTNTQISIKAGWNLIGYPSLINKTVNHALSSISGKYNMVEYYDPILKKEVKLGPDDWMEPGFGYWIHATENCILTI
jgi:hypothetical protein